MHKTFRSLIMIMFFSIFGFSFFGFYIGLFIGCGIAEFFTRDPLIILISMLFVPIAVNLYVFVTFSRAYSKISKESIDRINTEYQMQKDEVKNKGKAELRQFILGLPALFILFILAYILIYFQLIEAPLLDFNVTNLFLLIVLIYFLSFSYLLIVKGSKRDKDKYH